MTPKQNLYLTIAAAIAVVAGIAYFLAQPAKHKKQARKLTRTHAHWFVNPMTGKDTSSIVVREEIDTFKKTVKSIDAEKNDTVFKGSWMVDTVYYVPFPDTVRDRNGKVVYDSAAKKYHDTTYFKAIPRLFVITDDNKNYPF